MKSTTLLNRFALIRPGGKRRVRSSVLAVMLVAGLPLDAGSWLTGKSYNGHTVPLTVEPPEEVAPPASPLAVINSGPVRMNASAVTPVEVNLVVSLEADPQGSERLVWVNMMEHFADAIYEMTNGAHKLGEVKIYRNSARADSADIFWKANVNMLANRTPHVPGGGGILSDGRINMYELAVWREIVKAPFLTQGATIDKIHVQDGDVVSGGDVIVEIKRPDLKNYEVKVPDNVSGTIEFNTLDSNGNERPLINEGDAVGPYQLLFKVRTWEFSYLGDPENAGYTMAHEMGHYYYGVYDEYEINPGDETVSPSVMNSQWQASARKSSNKKWLNFSTQAPANGNPGDFQNTENTEHHRKLGASAWEVLARPPSRDPGKASQLAAERKRVWLGPRMHHPELAAVAPGAGEEPPVLLPNGIFSKNDRANLYLLNADGDPVDATAKDDDIARDLLEVIWMEGDQQDAVIVMDRSGSMTSDMMSQAKQAARILVNQMELGESRVAVLAYNSGVSVVQPLTELTTESDRQQVLNAIDGIFSGGSTAIGDAARTALNLLLSAGQGTETQVVFLLSDGLNNTGEDPRNVIPDYQNAQIPLFTFGYGSNADETLLREMAQQTGGTYYFSPTTLSEISQVFIEAGRVAGARPSLSSGQLTLNSQTTTRIPFSVDGSVSSFNLTFTYVGAPGDTTVTLVDPNGSRYTVSDTVVIGGEVQKVFNLDIPVTGEWTYEVVSGRNLSGAFQITSNIDGLTYSLDLTTRDGRTRFTGLGAEVILDARLFRETGVTGARVQARATNLDTGRTTPVLFTDDGTGVDLVAGDGTYSGLFSTNSYGRHRLVFQASNPDGTASLTDVGALSAPGPNGEQNEGARFVMIPEPFSRSESIDITVSPRRSVTRDFDGDGVDDVAVFRPTTGQWFLYRSQRGYGVVTWGRAKDVQAPADFTGDGRTDLAVFRPSNGRWFYQGGPAAGIRFGMRGDVPVPADYDGDGHADPAVYRARARNGGRANLWAVRRSSDGKIAMQTFGMPGDRPLVGDYTGDGIADMAVFRVSGGKGTFHIAGREPVAFGAPGDVPVAQDFDGDNIADIAIYRRSNGTWYYLPSTGGRVQRREWGGRDDLPIAGKYDDDDKADFAVFRYKRRQWFIDQSTGGSLGTGMGMLGLPPITWGVATDIPVGGYFDNDGTEDFGVYRRGKGTWILNSSRNGPVTVPWGGPGDNPIPGDWNGNGITDIAVFRPATGEWFIKYDNGADNRFVFGLAGDIPVPGDFDNDGSLEPAVFRKGLWFISSLGTIQHGIPGDVPHVGDFDGNGHTDLAVFRPGNGNWYIRYAGPSGVLGVTNISWGMKGDQTQVRDFNQDGADDLIVWRPRNGRWFIRLGDADSLEFQMGAPGDRPLVGDFDGDGDITPSLFRRGRWFILDSGTGTFRATPGPFQFGAKGDIPIGLTPPAP